MVIGRVSGEGTIDIYFDAYQEGLWFQDLHPQLSSAALIPFPDVPAGTPLEGVLAYDRPDIVVVSGGLPILVVERTVEVPSGHNVGQRFARLVAAARHQVPVLYIAPFVAYKHGGVTAGPRYMNLRLPVALKAMAAAEQSSATLIKWPVDATFEVMHGPEKDTKVREYLATLFDILLTYEPSEVDGQLSQSAFVDEQTADLLEFIATVKRATVYDAPPGSVTVVETSTLLKSLPQLNETRFETVLYDVGMRLLRSDPYAGAAMMYAYLYCGGLDQRDRNLVLRFPHITIATWRAAARLPVASKSTRLYRMVADAIVFRDGAIMQRAL